MILTTAQGLSAHRPCKRAAALPHVRPSDSLRLTVPSLARLGVAQIDPTLVPKGANHRAFVVRVHECHKKPDVPVALVAVKPLHRARERRSCQVRHPDALADVCRLDEGVPLSWNSRAVVRRSRWGKASAPVVESNNAWMSTRIARCDSVASSNPDPAYTSRRISR